jgi:tripartite-type tricarboxylate transporter receptor subunit TctC
VAQDFPSKPVRIVTSPPGATNDFVARVIAQGLIDPLGQPVIVDNRGGSVIPGDIVAKAQPDGYTLLLAGTSFLIGNLLQEAPYDPIGDFAPITLTTSSPNVLVVHSSVPVNSVKELVALAKAKPGVLNYSMGSKGGGAHLGAELFKSMAGINVVGVSYKGTGPALNGLAAGEVQFMISPASTAAAQIKSGRIKALAVTSAQPSTMVPGLPTVAASGLPGYEVLGIDGMFAPRRTPVAVIHRLNSEIVRVLARSDVKQKVLDVGVEAVGSSVEEFGRRTRSEIALWSKVIKDADIRSQ